jgi:intein/homing endonuclease
MADSKNSNRTDLFKRLTKLFSGGPTIKRKVRAFRPQAASSAADVFKKSYSQVYSNAMNAYGSYDRQCVSLDTKIAIPGERGYKTLNELMNEYPDGQKFIVYAYDHDKKSLTPAWAHHPRSSGFKDTVKIIFDDGQELICTHDHPCMLRDGTYKDAGELKKNDSMMPFYWTANKQEYEELKKNKNDARICSVEPWRKVEVGDLTVDGYENFATNTIICHNSRYSDFCFAPDALVYTTSGVFTIKQMAETPELARCKVYAYDLFNKKVVIADAHSPRLARDGIEQELVRVVFDDGGHIDVTPDHKFLLKGGEYKEACELTPGTSLQPFYKRDIVGDGYQWVYTNDRERSSGGWITEHLLVMEHLLGRKLKDNEAVHHKDFDRSNNLVENLVVMDKDEHYRYHAQINNRNKFGKSNDKNSKWMFENNPVRRNDITFDVILNAAIQNGFNKKTTKETLSACDNVINRRLRQRGFKNWVDFASKRDNIYEFLRHIAIVSETRSPELDEILETAPLCNTLYELCAKLRCTTNAVSRRLSTYGYGTWSEFKAKLNGVECKTTKKKGPRPDESITYQAICDAYSKTMTYRELSKKMGVPVSKIMRVIISEGFKTYSEWTDAFQNHKVVSVERLTQKQQVYNITVEGFHNLAMGSLNPSETSNNRQYSMVFVKQSEQEYTPEISSALDIWAEEATASDEKGRILHLYSENPKIKNILENFFYDTLNIEYNLTPWTRNLTKYGDFFTFLDVHPEMGIVNVFPMPVNEVERDEGWDPKNPQAVRFRWVTQGNQILEAWQVAHFRLLGNDAFLPYGSSVLESSRRIWRQLILIEDAMLVYRVVRSPERRVFYIDVGAVATEQIPNFMEAAKTTLRSAPVIDKSSGRVDLRYQPLSVDHDYFIPVRGTESGTKIDTLPGGQHVSDVADVEYLQKKLFAALKVPKAYLGYDDSLSSKATLCLRQNTPIKLTSGKVLFIKELENAHERGEKLEVYSYDIENQRVVPGAVTKVWPTKEVNELHRITLDSGEIIDCTENHPFLTRDGTYVRADKLKVGESLMPLYIDIFVVSVEVIKLAEPEWVYDLTVDTYHNFATEQGVFLHNSQEDIRFSRSVARIQRVLISELEKMCIIHLFAHGYEGEDLTDFSIYLSNPSTIAQMQKLELWRTKFEIASQLPDGIVDRDFVRKEIFQLSEQQIEEVRAGRKRDRLDDMEIESSELESTTGGVGGGGGGMGGLGGLPSGGEGEAFEEPGETAGAEAGAEGGAEAGAEEPAAGGGEEKIDLFAGEEDKSDDGDKLLANEEQDVAQPKATSLAAVLNVGDKKKTPANVSPISRKLYNRSRRKHHGPMALAMPKFSGALKSDDDPFDKRFFRKNPFGEAKSLLDVINSDEEPAVRSKSKALSTEMKATLDSLSRRLNIIGVRKKSASLLSEAADDVDVSLEEDDAEMLDDVVDAPFSPQDGSEQ